MYSYSSNVYKDTHTHIYKICIHTHTHTHGETLCPLIFYHISTFLSYPFPLMGKYILKNMRGVAILKRK